MGTQTRRSIVAAVAAFLLFGQVAIQEASAVRPLESYNPKDDPNYAGEATAPVQWETVLALAAEFDGTPIGSARQARLAGQSAVPQPTQYTDSNIAGGTSQAIPGAPVYGPYGYPAYGYTSWNVGWWHPSPSIPWWSLIPFARDDFRRSPFAFRGHFFFRNPHSVQQHAPSKRGWRGR